MKTQLLRLCTALLLFVFNKSHAQLKLPVTNNQLRQNLQKVISEYPQGFLNIRGDILIENPQSIEYESLLDFKDAEENTITRYDGNRPMYSWQAIMLSTEEFDVAKKKYKWLFNQLKVMTVTLDNGYSFTLSGLYEDPVESKKFASSAFQLTPAATGLPKVKIAVTLHYVFPEWKVGLMVYEKEREDKDRGPIKEMP